MDSQPLAIMDNEQDVQDTARLLWRKYAPPILHDIVLPDYDASHIMTYRAPNFFDNPPIGLVDKTLATFASNTLPTVPQEPPQSILRPVNPTTSTNHRLNPGRALERLTNALFFGPPKYDPAKHPKGYHGRWVDSGRMVAGTSEELRDLQLQFLDENDPVKGEEIWKRIEALKGGKVASPAVAWGEPGKYTSVAQAMADLSRRFPSTKFDLHGLTIKNANATAIAVIKVGEMYPEVMLALNSVNANPAAWSGEERNTYAATVEDKQAYKYNVVLNPTWFGSDNFQRQVEHDIEIGWHPRGVGTVTDVVVHELGHVVDFWFRFPEGARSRIQRGEDVWEDVPGKRPQAAFYGFSRYAKTNDYERIAEVFMAMTLNPDNKVMGATTNGLGTAMNVALGKKLPGHVNWTGVRPPKAPPKLDVGGMTAAERKDYNRLVERYGKGWAK